MLAPSPPGRSARAPTRLFGDGAGSASSKRVQKRDLGANQSHRHDGEAGDHVGQADAPTGPCADDGAGTLPARAPPG